MRTVIVEDHALISDFLLRVCRIQLGHSEVTVAQNGLTAITSILEKRTDLVLLDLGLPDIDGFSVVSSIRSAGASPLIVVLSGYCNAFTVGQSVEARVDGFVDKNTSTVGDICRAITRATSNKKFFSNSYLTIQRALKADPLSYPKVLSMLQQTVLRMISNALTDSEIAIRLGRSRYAAEKHRFRILGRLGLKTTQELIRYAHKNGFDSLGLPSAH
jgi:two-component system, NarL family, response regulator NreC